MAIIYSNVKSAKRARVLPYDEQPASEYWATHYQNLLLLQKIARSAQDFNMRAQARDEMSIAERKMTFWKRHPNWNQREVESMMSEVKRAA